MTYTGLVIRGSKPGRGKRFFFLFAETFTPAMGPTSFIINVYRRSLPEVKCPGRDVDYAPPCSAEVKNEWSYTSDSPMCLRGMDRDNFGFFTF